MAINQFEQTLEDLGEPEQASPTQNPFEETLRLQAEGQQKRMQVAQTKALETVPDRAAESIRLSQSTGLPVEVIERNFDDIVKRSRIAETPYTQMQRETPHLAQWAEDPGNAAVAQDDMENLGALEWLVTAPQRAFAKGLHQIDVAQLRAASLLRPLTQAEQDRLNTARFYMRQGGEFGAKDSWFRGAVTGTAEQLPILFGSALYGLRRAIPAAVTAGAAGAMMGPAAPFSVPTMFGFGLTAGMLGGAAEFGFQLEAGLALDELSDFKDELNQTIDPDAARAAALGVGAINAGLEAAGLGVLLKSIPGADKLVGGVTRNAARAALRSPTVRAALAQAVKGYGGALAGETSVEVAQRAVTIMAGELSKYATGPQVQRMTAEEVGADLAQEAAGALQSFALMLLPGPALGTFHDLRRARQAEQSVAFYKALGERVTASQTVARMPQAVQDLLTRATKDGPISTLYAPVETFQTYWQSKGIDPAEIAEELTGDPQAFQEALRTGRDLEIPTGAYAVKLAGTEHNAFFANELRLGPEEMNAREAESFMQAFKAAEAQAEQQQPVGIREAILQRLQMALAGTNVKLPEGALEAYADAYESAFVGQAEREGMDPRALFEQYGPTIVGPGQEPPAGRPGPGPGPAPFPSTGTSAAAPAQEPAQAETQAPQEPTVVDIIEALRSEATSPTAAAPAPSPYAPIIAREPAFTPEAQRALMLELASDPAAVAGARDLMARRAEIDAARGGTQEPTATAEVTAAATAPTPDAERLAKARQMLDAEFPPGSPERQALVDIQDKIDPEQLREFFQAVFHGSPHEFDRFSLHAIGTGEGNQAYGWGLYFASLREVAERYKQSEGRDWTVTFPNGDRLELPNWVARGLRLADEERAKGAARVAELEALATDEAMGVEFAEDGESTLPGGAAAVVCTNCAERIIELAGGKGAVFGWADDANPTATVTGTTPGDGHDFAIIEHRYLVDPWAAHVAVTSTRAAYDLQNPTDRAAVLALYGDPQTWTERRKVGDDYSWMPQPEGVTLENMFPSRVEEMRDDFRGRIAEEDYEHGRIPGLQNVVTALERYLQEGGVVREPGRLYRVEIPEDPDFLDWDLPASQQPPKVQAALRALGVDWKPLRVPTPKQGLRLFESRRLQDLAASDIGIRESIANGYRLANNAATFGRAQDTAAWSVWYGKHQGFFAQGMIDPTGEIVYRDLVAKHDRDVRSELHRPAGAAVEAAKRASKELSRHGLAGIKYLDGFSRGAGIGSSNYVVVDESLVSIIEMFQGPKVLPAGWDIVAPHLTEQERAKLKSHHALRLVEVFKSLPSDADFSAAALAGIAKRGWYAQSAEAIRQVFGDIDAPRFAALLAALSPQTSVESNLYNTVSVWQNWVKAGRPTTRKAIIRVMAKSVQGKKGVESVLDSWINNTVRALTAEDPTSIVLSGPKVHSFYRNLVGAVNEVTNDAWMANFAYVDQKLFAGSINVAGTDPGRTPGYLAMVAKIRRVAKRLTQETGQTWTAAEVQETIWSWAKTLYEMSESEGMTAEDFLKSGRLTDAAIAATPDFKQLFTADASVRAILEGAGYGPTLRALEQELSDDARRDPGREAAARVAAGEQGRPVTLGSLRSARRLDRLRAERREAERLKAEEVELFQAQRFVDATAPEQGAMQRGFYSRILRTIADSTQARATGAQWKAVIKNSKLGVNLDEFMFTSVEDLEDGRTYTKQEVLDYLGVHQVVLSDIVLGSDADTGAMQKFERQVQELADERFDEAVDEYVRDADLSDYYNTPDPQTEARDIEDPDNPDETIMVWFAVVDGEVVGGEDSDYYATEDEALDAAVETANEEEDRRRERAQEDLEERAREEISYSEIEEEVREELERDGEMPWGVKTFFSEYTERGLTESTYREAFVTAPGVKGTPVTKAMRDELRAAEQAIYSAREAVEKARSALTAAGFRYHHEDATLSTVAFQEIEKEFIEAQAREKEVQRKYRELDRTIRRAENPQWNDGHDEFEPVENPVVRVRFDARTGTTVESAEALKAAHDQALVDYLGAGPTRAEEAKTALEQARAKRTESEMRVLFIEEIQPPQPDQFETMPALFQKNWREIGFKWALRYAVEQGFDAIAWTTGEQQVERYLLEKTVSKIEWLAINETLQPPPTPPAKFDIKLRLTHGSTISLKTDRAGIVAWAPDRAANWAGRHLSEVIGKELADQVLEKPDGGEIDSKGLRVGGEGLRRLYDIDFRNVVQALPAVKKAKGKVERIEVGITPKRPYFARPFRPAVRSWRVVSGTPWGNAAYDFEGMVYLDQAQEKREVAVLATRDEAVAYAARMNRTAREDGLLNVVGYGIQAQVVEGELRYQAIGPEMSIHGDFATMEEAEALANELNNKTRPGQPGLVLSDDIKTAVMAGQALFQDRRGFIRFGPDRKFTIGFFENADVSTFMHESAHLYLEMMSDLVARPEASAQIVADWSTLQDWFFGVGVRGEIGVAQHEQFARAFEAYLMEGRAPTLGLQSVFTRFRAWLTRLYRSLRSLDVELTPSVRKVLDRMLASDQAIADAEAAIASTPMFTTAEAAGMSEEQFDLYKATVADASRKARETLERKLLAEVQREQRLAYRQQKDDVRERIRQELGALPIYQALSAMRFGTRPDGSPLADDTSEPLRLSREIIVNRYGEERLRALPRPYIYSAEGGLDPDVVAQMYGFSSGDALLTEATAATPFRQAVEAETDRRMRAEYGDLVLDGQLNEVAQAAVANDNRDSIIRTELRALGQLRRTAEPFVQAGEAAVATEQRERAYERRWFEAEARLRVAIAEGRKQVEIDALEAEVQNLRKKARGGAATVRAGVPPDGVLRAAAAERIGRTRIGAISPQTFWAAARQASRKAFEAAARQDFDGAIVAKQQELINLALYREASNAQEKVAARVRFAKSLTQPAARARLGRAGESYLDQVDGILDRFDFARISQKAMARRGSLRKWVAALEGQGLPVDLPDIVLEEMFRKNYQELTYGELVDVTDALEQVLHLSRLKNRLLKQKKQRELAALAADLAESIRANTKRRPPTTGRLPADEAVRLMQDFFASHRKLSSLAREFDGFADGGPMWEAFIRPLNEAGDREAVMNAAATKALDALVKAAYPSGRERRALYVDAHIPEVGKSFTKMERIMVALNWGNDGNRQRIRDGFKWTDDQVRAVLETLDENDWTFIQGVWDHINSYWPDIAAKQQRVTGLAPEKVEAVPVQTRFGEMRGGYFPIKYDPRLTPKAGAFLDLEAGDLQKQAAYVRATTKRGHTEARVATVKLPVRLDFGVITEHLQQVIHDLSHHEMLIDAGRVLGHPDVQAAIYETYGDLVYSQFKNGLRDVAFGQPPATGAFEKGMNHLRVGSTVAGLGWNLTTAFLQPLGLTQSMVRIGPSWVARGMIRWTRDAVSMENTVAWISSKSSFMKLRGQTQQREINEIRNTIGLNTGRMGGWMDDILRTASRDIVTQQGMADSFFFLIQQMQRVADVPTWLGQYEKAMAGGATEDEAVAQADQAVLDAQGGGQIKDLAAVQRGGPLLKLWTNFYSFFSTTYQLSAEATRRTSFRKPGQIGRLAVDYLLLYTVPATLGMLLRAAMRPGDDDEDLASAMIRENVSYIMGTLLGLREVSGAIQGYAGYEGPAGARAFSSAARLVKQVEQGETDAAFWRALNESAGILFHYPAGQVRRTVEGAAALIEGTSSNPMVLVTGAPK